MRSIQISLDRTDGFDRGGLAVEHADLEGLVVGRELEVAFGAQQAAVLVGGHGVRGKDTNWNSCHSVSPLGKIGARWLGVKKKGVESAYGV